ncbi:MAG: hypothetical protein C0179_05570, partial [Fervidicoccus sp.]
KYFPFQVDRIVYMFTSAIRFLESIDKSFLEIVLDAIDKIPIRGTPHEEVLRRYLYATLDTDSGFTKETIIEVLNNLPSKYVPAKYYVQKPRLFQPFSKKLFFSYVFVGELIFLVLNRLTASYGIKNVAKLLDKYRKPYGEIPSYLTSMLLDILLRYREGHGKLVSVESFIGAGKTTYTFFSIANALKILLRDYSDREIEKMTEKLFVGDIESFIQLVDEALAKDVKIPVLVIDDVSVWLHPYWMWTTGEEKKIFRKLRDQFIAARRAFGSLILVANNPKDIASFVRRLIEERVVGETSKTHTLATTTLFYHETKSENTPIDVFIYPLLKLPDSYFQKDQKRKEEILRKRQEEIKEIAKEEKEEEQEQQNINI